MTLALRQRGDVWARTAWVAEFGREYSANLLALARAKSPSAGVADIIWQSADFSTIAQRQCQLEQDAARHGSPVLICDTDALATCIWHERYLGQPSVDVEHIAASMPPRALYLLTSDEGVPFEDDGLRDGEHLRAWMTGRFQARLAQQAVPWLELKGSRESRCQNALAAVDAMMANAWRFAIPLG